MRTAATLPFLLLLLGVGSCASGAGTTSGAPAAAAPTTPASAPSTVAPVPAGSSAIYSRAQAERGQSTFRAVCAECHYSSEFRGSQFQFSWRRRSVADFFEEVSSTMPEDAPGSLDPAVYLDVVAYILELNGFPAGTTDLPLDEAVLDTHSMAAPPGGPAPRGDAT